MAYDGLDRLTSANAPQLWGNASFTYNVLDNLRTSIRGAVHSYDARNRLSSVSGDGLSLSYAHDVNGNVSQRGSETFVFDVGNRMVMSRGSQAADGSTSSTGWSTYVYDGHGRRMQIGRSDGLTRIHLYSENGQLMYAHNSGGGRPTSTTKYVYLGSPLIAEVDSAGGAQYGHTDVLGSPVARTNSTAGIVSRTQYTPYGRVWAGTTPVVPNSTGFAGHVNDEQSGLVYMQQRYCDPSTGQFLSVDPVVTNAMTGSMFSRYNYAYNNPYLYRDPDGRFGLPGALVGGGIEALAQWSVSGSISDWKAVAVAGAVGAVTGGVGGYAAKAALTGVTSAGKAVAATAAAGGAAAAAGKHVEMALKGETASAKDVAIAAVGGALVRARERRSQTEQQAALRRWLRQRMALWRA